MLSPKSDTNPLYLMSRKQSPRKYATYECCKNELNPVRKLTPEEPKVTQNHKSRNDRKKPVFTGPIKEHKGLDIFKSQ